MGTKEKKGEAMGLEIIHIKNYKCIRDYKLNLKQMNLLLGENGSGKTNILSAVVYFYANMISQKPSYHVFDENNPLNDQIEIALTYDMGKLLMRSRKNRKEKKDKYLGYYNVIGGMAENGRITLTMSQVKDGRITWSHGIEKRKVLYHLYPLYKLDAREINLVDWEDLWEDIGDLVKLTSKENEEMHESVSAAVKAEDGRMKRRLELLDDVFARLQIRPVKFSVSEFSANMAKMYYSGSQFSYAGRRLDSFSNGTNSYNYISLLLYVLSAMGRTKMKEPVFLMDEPEISLHFHMIDELADVLFDCIDDITVLAATHSPRFVKNILVKEHDNCAIYQVYKRGAYSRLCLLSMFAKEEKREKYFLTEHHANAFFAKMLLLVEGETELELLQNPYLKMLFPVLKEAEVIKGLSDKVIYRMIDTTTRHYNVPMAALLDMDKILQWDDVHNIMIWKEEYQYVARREKYYYGEKRNATVPKRKRIEAMCARCRFSYRLPFYASEDPAYGELIGTIQAYYGNYQIFPVKTTIEGALVNRDNYGLLIQYLTETGKWKHVEKAFSLLYNETDQVNFLRLLFHGKSDFLLKSTAVLNKNKKLYPELRKALKGHAIAKTDWVSGWLEYYFSKMTRIPREKMKERRFGEWCANPVRRNVLARRFCGDFPELYGFIDSVDRLYHRYYA